MLVNDKNMFDIVNKKIREFFTKGSQRTLLVKKNILGSLFLKCISILVSLQVVPLTINYINPTKYGIWLTLSSIIAWLSYFDLGFAHGFRNRFTEAIANNNIVLARQYVSTTYAVLSLLFFVVLVLALVVNCFLDWSSILNIDSVYSEELSVVFSLLVCFLCLNIVASVFTTMLTADQRPALVSCIQTGGQLLAFLCIYILTKTTSGDLTMLAFVFSGIPCLMLLVVSCVMFRTKRYRKVAPSFKHIRFSLTKSIVGLGGQLFLIMVSMLFIFQFINIILSRVHGPEAVTQYNIAYKYFNVLNMVFVIILTPFWSAFTDAYAKEDFGWMRSALHKLESIWLLCIPTLLIMLFFSDFLYSWWIGDSVTVPLSLSISMALYVLFQTGGGVYMYLINGTSMVRIQLLIYLVFAFVSIPLMTYCSRLYGVGGILYIPICVFIIQIIISKIQLNKIINGTATGIWAK